LKVNHSRYIGDTNLFPKFSTTKVLTCLKPTKGHVALNPKSSSNNHLDKVRLFTINSHEEEGNTNFPRLNHKIESYRVTPSCLVDESPRVKNVNEVIAEDVEVLLLETQGSLERWPQSPL
jgi:hypothetical protein